MKNFNKKRCENLSKKSKFWECKTHLRREIYPRAPNNDGLTQNRNIDLRMTRGH